MMGMYNNRSIFFDPVTFNYEVRSFPEPEKPQTEGQIVDENTTPPPPSSEDYVEKTEIAGSDPASELIAKEFRQSPTRLMSFVLDTGVMPSGLTSQEQLDAWNQEKSKSNFDFKDTVVQSIMRYNQLFTVKTDITIPGDFTIKAGDVIECSFPELSGAESEEVNSETKGKYMVASVCHRVTPDSSTTSLSLVRDSFGGK